MLVSGLRHVRLTSSRLAHRSFVPQARTYLLPAAVLRDKVGTARAHTQTAGQMGSQGPLHVVSCASLLEIWLSQLQESQLTGFFSTLAAAGCDWGRSSWPGCCTQRPAGRPARHSAGGW